MMNFNVGVDTAIKTGESAYVFEKGRCWTRKPGLVTLAIETINCGPTDLGIQSETLLNMTPDQARKLVTALLKTIQEADRV